ncbi:MAG: pilin [Patescibacteria group bacterium]
MKFSLIVTITILFIGLALPESVTAQNFLTCEGTNCSFCNLVSMGNVFVSWLIGILFLLVAVVMAVAGIKLVISAGDVSAREYAKDRFASAIIGLIIVLAAWLVVDTLFRVLLPGDQGTITGYGPWQQVQCQTQTVSVQFFVGAGVDEQSFLDDPTEAPTDFVPGEVSEGQLQHDEALSQLQNAGIVVTSTQGPSGVRTDCTGIDRCTTLGGINEDTVNQTLNIRNACPTCNIVVTGATEGGHAGGDFSHANGYKIDLDDNPALDNYLQTTLTRSGTREGSHGGPRYVDSCGNEYVREATHWDISVTNGACSL